MVEPLILKDITVRLERIDLSPATFQRLKRVQKDNKKRKEREDSSESSSSPPKRTRSQTRKPNRAGSSSETADPDGEVTRYFTGKKVGLTNATLRCRGPRVLTAHLLRLAKKTNSDSAKLNMQKKANAKKFAHQPSTGIGKNAMYGTTLGDDRGMMMMHEVSVSGKGNSVCTPKRTRPRVGSIPSKFESPRNFSSRCLVVRTLCTFFWRQQITTSPNSGVQGRRHRHEKWVESLKAG